MNKNRRLTRNSFKRKLIGLLASISISIALIASGFASWVISTDAQVKANVGVTVGTVSLSNMAIEVDGLNAEGSLEQDLRFDPVKTDNSGRVRYGDEDGEGGGEQLTLIVTGHVTNAQHLGSLSIKIDYSNTNLLKVSALESGYSNEYITLPLGFDEEHKQLFTLNQTATDKSQLNSGEYMLVSEVDSNGNPVTEYGYQVKTAYFKCVITFGWGEFFAGVNPCYYYDGVDESGIKLSNYNQIMALTANDIKNQLNAFKALIEENGAGTLKLVIEVNTN